MIPRSILARRIRGVTSSQSLTPWVRQTPRSLARPWPTTLCTARCLTSTSTTALLATPANRAATIQAPLPSVSSTVVRLLPPHMTDQQLPLPRQICETVIAKVLQQVRSAADANTVEAAKTSWTELDEQIRHDLISQGHLASSLTDLTSILIASSGDPRRHPIAFNMYRIAFGSDPAQLPALELEVGKLPAHQASVLIAPAHDDAGQTRWGDWQASYHWANLVLQGRAPPPPGTYLLGPGEQRAAQASQASAAYRVFAHLASRGHPQGMFGIGRHLLSTLERGIDPTALGAMPKSFAAQPRTRQETVEEVERMYRLAAEAGVEEAWFELAALYMEGKWVRKNDERARSLLREGVERGSSRACRALSHLMTKEAQARPAPSSLDLKGDKVDASKREALLADSLRLLERGAELGSIDCAFSAGMRYLLQLPAPTDKDGEASESSSVRLDTSLDPSAPASASREQAEPLDLATRAREEHISKWSVEPSDELAAKWFAKAIEGGHALSMMNLARMYLEQRVVPAPTTAAAADPGTSDSASTSPRELQLLHASRLYARVLAKAMGPEGQRSKAMAEIQSKIAGVDGGGSRATGASTTLGPGQDLDELGVRAQEGLRLVNDEVAILKGR